MGSSPDDCEYGDEATDSTVEQLADRLRAVSDPSPGARFDRDAIWSKVQEKLDRQRGAQNAEVDDDQPGK